MQNTFYNFALKSQAMYRLIVLWAFLFPAMLFAQTSDELYTQGVALKNDKKVKEALAKFQEVVKKNPAYFKATYEIGWCQNDLQNYPEALKALKLARKDMSDQPKLFFELGYAFEKSGLYDSAIASYEKCKLLKSNYTAVIKRMGYTYAANDKYDLALAKYQEHLIASPKESDYVFWYKKGFAENALKKYEEANTSLAKSLELKNDYVNTYLELGYANARLKKDEIAIEYFTKAMPLDPKSHVAYNGIAEIYRDNKKDMPKAMEWYQKALAIKPNERKANYGIGYCLNSQQKYAEAVPYILKAIEYEKSYVAAYTELGYSYYKLENFSEAEKNLLQSLKLNPANETPRYYLCLMYIKQGKKEKAQQLVDELKKTNYKYAPTLQESINKL
jgi:tetratricopeptide (TPR) repeat protein